MRLYVNDCGWEGARIFVAENREEAVKIIKELYPPRIVPEMKRIFESVQTIATVDRIPDTKLFKYTFKNHDAQVVTKDTYSVGDKVAFSPAGSLYNGEYVTRRRFKGVWSDGLVGPFYGKAEDGWEVKGYNYAEDTVRLESDADLLRYWAEYEIKPGLMITTSGDC